MANNYDAMPVYMKVNSEASHLQSLSSTSGPSKEQILAARHNRIHDVLDLIERSGPDAAKACKSLLFTYINNVANDPDNPKFKKLGTRNPFFISQIKSVPGGIDFLVLAGFMMSTDNDWMNYTAPDLVPIKIAREALTKPYVRPASERKEDEKREKERREKEKERQKLEKEREKERERQERAEREYRESGKKDGSGRGNDKRAPNASPQRIPIAAANTHNNLPILLSPRAIGGPPVKMPGAFFGASLKAIMDKQKEKYPQLRVPRFFLLATRFLLQHGLTYEGVFRISARVENVNSIKERLDATHPDYEFGSNEEVPTVTGVLTSFLRELTSPLLPADFYHELLSLVTEKQAQFPEVQVALLTKIIANISALNQCLLSELFWFLSVVAQNADFNKMTRDNLSRLMGPNIIWIKHTPKMDITQMHLDSERVTGLVNLILSNYRTVFQDTCPPLAWKDEIGVHGRIFTGLKKPVMMMCQPTPRLVWLLDSSNAVRIWDCVHFTFIKEFIVEKGAVLHMAGVEGKVWLCQSKALTIYNAENAAIMKEHPTAAFYAERALTGNTVLVSLWDGIRSFNAETLEPAGPFYTTPPDAKLLRFAGGRLWTGASKSVCVFDVETRAVLREHRPHTRPVVSLVELCDARLLSAASDGSLAVFSLESLEPIHRMEAPNPTVRLIGAVSPPGTDFLFTASQDGTLRQYNSRTWQVVRDITSPPGEALSAISLITRSPADTVPYLCVAFNDMYLQIYRIPDGTKNPRAAVASGPAIASSQVLARQLSMQMPKITHSLAHSTTMGNLNAPKVDHQTHTSSPSASVSVPVPVPLLPIPVPPTSTPTLGLSMTPNGSNLSRSPRSIAMPVEPNASILPAEGFRVENGKKTPLPGLELNMYDYSDHYRTHFAGKKQVHFVGYMSTDESAPAVVSVLVQPDVGKYPEPVFKGIVRTKSSGQDMFFIPQSDVGKALIPKGREKEEAFSVRMHVHLEETFFHGARLYMVNNSDAPSVEADLLEFEKNDPERSNCFAFGVVYVKDGQSMCKEFWENEHGSAGFERFLTLLGERVKLKGWSKFRGVWSVYTKFQEKFEVMYHVSSLLPFQASDPLKLSRARQVQNDVVVLLYIEGNQQYAPETMPTNVSHVFAVVRPVIEDGETKYKLAVVSKDNVNAFRPDLPQTLFRHDDYFRNFLLTKLINGQIAARKSGLQMMFTRPRAAMIEDLVATYKPGKQRSGTATAALDLLRSLSPQRTRSGTGEKSEESSSSGSSPSPQHTQPRGLGALFHRSPQSSYVAASPVSPVSQIPQATSAPLARHRGQQADGPSNLGKQQNRREISPQVEQSLSRVEELLQRVDDTKR